MDIFLNIPGLARPDAFLLFLFNGQLPHAENITFNLMSLPLEDTA
jgi:hypothetical protein